MGVSTSEGNGILHTDESGAEYLQYVEDVSKSNNGGLAHLQIKNKFQLPALYPIMPLASVIIY